MATNPLPFAPLDRWSAVGFAGHHTRRSAERPDTADLRHATMLSGFVEARAPARRSLVPPDSDRVATRSRFGLEARGYWLRPGADASAFAATVALRVAVRPGGRLVPFGMAGVGAYSARFQKSLDGVPEFYRARLIVPQTFSSATFTDPVLSVGGGADVWISRHVALRPEVNMLLVMTRSDVRAVPAYGLQLVFHFDANETIR